MTVYDWLKLKYCNVAALNILSSAFYSLVISGLVLETLRQFSENLKLF